MRKITAIILFLVINLFSTILYAQNITEKELSEIIRNNNVSTLENLLQNGLDPNKSIKIKVQISTYWGMGSDIEEKEMSLVEAAAHKGKSEIAKMLIKYKANISGVHGEKVLNDFIQYDDYKMIEYLVPNFITPELPSLALALKLDNLNIINKICLNISDQVSDQEMFTAFTDIGESKYFKKDYSKAIVYYNAVSHYKNQEKDKIYLYRGESYYYLNHFEEALQDFDSYIELALKNNSKTKKYAHIYIFRGICKIQLGKNKESYCSDFREAEKLGFDINSVEELKKYCQ